MESKRPVPDGQKTVQHSADPEALGAILMTIGDTTWRMFIPTVIFTLLGVWADTRFVTTDGSSATKPWLMIVGIILGCVCAGLLVKKQIDRLKKEAR